MTELQVAEGFFENRLITFRKDMRICLTPDGNNDHAYMPALITCIGHLELVSCLLLGELNPGAGKVLPEIQKFARCYIARPSFSDPNLEILYLAYRHKIAHAGAPYLAFERWGKRITWVVHANRGTGAPAFELLPEKGRFAVAPHRPPFDHRFHICLSAFQADLETGIANYRAHLRTDSTVLKQFTDAIQAYYK